MPKLHADPIIKCCYILTVNCMAKVSCSIEETSLEGDYNYEVEGVCATCSRCGHTIESYGTSDDSKLSCLARMREECPKGESNFYEEEE
jgi:hypothetical protein